MAFTTYISIVLLGLWMVEAAYIHGGDPDVNFISRGTTAFGEMQIKVSYNGVQVIETVIPSEGEDGLFLREITDGKRLVKNIYQGKEFIVDCDILTDEEDMSDFYDRFVGRKSVHGNTAENVTMETIELDIAEEYEELVDYSNQVSLCRELHSELKRTQRAKKAETKANSARVGDEGEDIAATANDDTAAAPSSSSSSSSSTRVKRAMFIYPGTYWCGSGSQAGTYHELGENIATDKCCRAHDHCPYTIEGFTTKFNMFNYRFHTLSHCNCDESFRACLKAASNSVANMVGDLFFNVIGTTCFTLKPENTCERRSWWGKCLEYKKEYTAYIEEPGIIY